MRKPYTLDKPSAKPKNRRAAYETEKEFQLRMEEKTERQLNAIKYMVARNIKRAREEFNLTQKSLGELIGVSLQQVQKYETGINRISADTLILLANKLDVNLFYFTEMNLTRRK